MSKNLTNSLLFHTPLDSGCGLQACCIVLRLSMPLKDFSTPPKPKVFIGFSWFLATLQGARTRAEREQLLGVTHNISASGL